MSLVVFNLHMNDLSNDIVSTMKQLVDSALEIKILLVLVS